MSDPTERTQVNPHPVSQHRTPREIALDEAGPIGQADGDLDPKESSARKGTRELAVRHSPRTKRGKRR